MQTSPGKARYRRHAEARRGLQCRWRLMMVDVSAAMNTSVLRVDTSLSVVPLDFQLGNLLGGKRLERQEIRPAWPGLERRSSHRRTVRMVRVGAGRYQFQGRPPAVEAPIVSTLPLQNPRARFGLIGMEWNRRELRLYGFPRIVDG